MLSMLIGPLVNNIADKLNERELVGIVGFAIALACFLFQLVAQVLSKRAAFPFLLVVYALHYASASTAYPLVCAMSLTRLKRQYGADAHDRFGRDRLWGAVSWALVALAFGAIADYTSDVEILSYSGKSVFGVIFIAALAHTRIHRNSDKTTERTPLVLDDAIEYVHENEVKNDLESSPGKKENLSAKTVFHALTQGGLPTISFYILAFILTGGMVNVENLLFIYFKADLGASYTLCGLTVVVTVIFEIPLFALAPQLIQSLGSKYLAVIGALSFVVRTIGYSLVRSSWAVLLFEPLHGVTFAAMATASVSFVSERSPTQMEATSQSLLYALLQVAKVTGVAFGGMVMQMFGSRVLYSGVAVMVLIATVAFLVVDKVYRVNSEQESRDRDVLLNEM